MGWKNLGMKTIIICLERNTLRHPNVAFHLKTMPNSILLPAVDGRMLNFAIGETGRKGSESLGVFIEYGDSLRIPHNPNIRKHQSFGYNECACAVSHLLAYKEFLKSKEDTCLILEDDAICADIFGFSNLLTKLPPVDTWDLCHMYYTFANKRGKDGKPIDKYFSDVSVGGFNTTTAYILTREGAETLIKHLSTVNEPSDDSLSKLCQEGRLRTIRPTQNYWKTLEDTSTIWPNPEGLPDPQLRAQWDKPYRNWWVGVELGKWSGLGNQMFQYASVKSLSLDKGVHLKIQPAHNYLLDKVFPYLTRETKVTDLGNRIVWHEKGLGFDREFFEQGTREVPEGDMAREIVNRNLGWEIEGYLQNVRYFEKYESLLRLIFRFEESVDDECNRVIKNFKTDRGHALTKIIGVHIRLPNEYSEDVNNVCYAFPTKRFIFDSLTYFNVKYPGCLFIFISNDVGRGQEIYGTMFAERSIWITLPAIGADMCLLSKCDHYVLSPSTYGWWGSWLNPSPDKEVITCRPFFNTKVGSGQRMERELDIALPGWIVYDMVKPEKLKVFDSSCSSVNV